MKRADLRLEDYLGHIHQAIQHINDYLVDVSKETFLESSLLQDTVIRNLEIIGEASHNIETVAPAFAAAHPELPLVFAYRMRNAVSHGYFGVDTELVWDTVKNDLPGFQCRVQELIAELSLPER